MGKPNIDNRTRHSFEYLLLQQIRCEGEIDSATGTITFHSMSPPICTRRDERIRHSRGDYLAKIQAEVRSMTRRRFGVRL